MQLKRSFIAMVSALLASTGIAFAEGELQIYNWGNYTNPDVIKKFEEKYQVKVTVTDYDSNDTALAKIRQGGHGFDIAVPSQNYLPIWISEGLLLETNPGQMENAKNLAPEWKDPEFDKGRKYSVPWQLGTIGISVNTDIYKGPLDTWAVVFDVPAELKGKINVVPEMNDVIASAIAYVGGEYCTSNLQTMKKVRDLLVNAKKDWIAMEYSTVEKMTAGDYAATLDWNGASLRSRLANPAIRYIQPKEGMVLWSDNLVVLKDAKNVENAKLFQNFIMDPEMAAGLSAFARYGNGIAGSDAFMPADMKGAEELAVPSYVKNIAYSRACPPESQELYTKIWTELQK